MQMGDTRRKRCSTALNEAKQWKSSLYLSLSLSV